MWWQGSGNQIDACLSQVVWTITALAISATDGKLSCPYGQIDEMSAVACLEPRAHVRDVLFNSAFASMQAFGDLADRQSVRDKG